MIRYKLLGYRYWVCSIAPGELNYTQYLKLEYRDNIEDAQKIIDVLYETSILYDTYGIIAESVYSTEAEKEPEVKPSTDRWGTYTHSLSWAPLSKICSPCKILEETKEFFYVSYFDRYTTESWINTWVYKGYIEEID